MAPLLCLASALGGDDPAPKAPIDPARKSAAELDASGESEALAFVREHHPELATVLEALKPMDPAEYHRAIVELSGVARNLAAQKLRNPGRSERSLAAWKARSRVELLAAQLAGSPSDELRARLRSAIEAKVDAEIDRQRFELEQAEAAAKKAREAIDRLETHRDSVVEARFRALQPRKAAKARKPANPPAKPEPAATPTWKLNGEDR